MKLANTKKGFYMSFNIQNSLPINRKLSFKGYDKNFSIDKVQCRDVAEVILKDDSKIRNCGYVNLSMSDGDDVCIKPKVPFNLTTGVLNEGEKVFLNADTMRNIKTNGNGSLIVPVGVGERYNEVQQYLKLNLVSEEIAKSAERKLTSGCIGGHYDKHITKLVQLMNISKCAEKFLLQNIEKIQSTKN